MGNLYQEKGKNIRRTWLLMAVFIGAVLGIGWVFSYILDTYLIFIGALVLSIIMNVGSYWFSDKIVLSLHRARPLDRDNTEEDEVYRLVENIAMTAGLPQPDVYIMEDQALNAFATGRNPEHGVVVVTRGLLNALNKTEMEGVLAHEMSHIGNRDTLIQSVAVVLVGLIVLLAEWFLNVSLLGLGRNSNEGGGAFQIGMMILGFVLALLAPVLAQVMQAAISRKRELLADSSGALLTRYPEGLADALRKISGQNTTSVQTASKATAHMFLVNPLNMNKDKLAGLFASHPPVEKRIEALMGMDIESNTQTT